MIKTLLSILCLLTCLTSMAQSPAENDVLQLSSRIFKWEVNNDFDSLNNILSDKFLVVSSAGETQNKKEYLGRLSGGNFAHRQINIEQNISTVAGNTATVIGKGVFIVVVSGKEAILHLSFMEVFTWEGSQKSWQLLAIYANRLPN
jgi:hypothetical protein